MSKPVSCVGYCTWSSKVKDYTTTPISEYMKCSGCGAKKSLDSYVFDTSSYVKLPALSKKKVKK